MTHPEEGPDWVPAYLRERAGAARAGQSARVAEIDAELARRGYAPEPVPAAEEPVSSTESPRRRRTPPRDRT